VKTRWPKEAPVFRDGIAGMSDFFEGTDVRAGAIEGFIIATRRSFRGCEFGIAKTGYQGDDDCVGLQFLEPLTPAARAMLAIAKSGAK